MMDEIIEDESIKDASKPQALQVFGDTSGTFAASKNNFQIQNLADPSFRSKILKSNSTTAFYSSEQNQIAQHNSSLVEKFRKSRSTLFSRVK